MPIRHGWRHAARVFLAGSAALACAITTVAATQSPAAATPVSSTARYRHICRSKNHHPGRADKMSRQILRALRGRKSNVGLRVVDPHMGIVCGYHAGRHFTSASAVKTIILASLMLKEHTADLSASQKYLAKKMITRSNNKAADALWVQTGLPAMQHFLNLAHMNETRLPYSQPGLWGLTELTAHDETTLMWLLMKHGHVLTNAERAYELRLMAEVVPWQRFGISAGEPTNYTLHIKNGWARDPYGDWRVNSTGCFTKGNGSRDYSIVVLTNHDGYSGSGFQYGVTTIDRVASRVNHDLTPTSNHGPSRTAPPLLGRAGDGSPV